MLRRWVIIGVVAALPLAALADTSSATGPAQDTNGLQSGSSDGLTSPISSLLQPAPSGSAASALQSADASGGGAGQSATQNLQQTGSSDQVKLLVEGEADGPHNASDSQETTWLGYAALILIIATAITALVWWLRRRA